MAVSTLKPVWRDISNLRHVFVREMWCSFLHLFQKKQIVIHGEISLQTNAACLSPFVGDYFSQETKWIDMHRISSFISEKSRQSMMSHIWEFTAHCTISQKVSFMITSIQLELRYFQEHLQHQSWQLKTCISLFFIKHFHPLFPWHSN